VQLDLDDLYVLEDTLRRFNKSTAAGPDGMRIGHLLAGVSQRIPEHKKQYLTALGKAVNTFLRGSLPKTVSPFFAAAYLVPLRKKDSLAPRPIAVGNIFRRLTGKVALALVGSKLTDYFGVSQVGVRTRNGADGVIHAINALYRGNMTSERIGVLQIDNTNAFNLVSREWIFAQVRSVCPGILPLVYAHANPQLYLYSATGEVIMLDSGAGAQQGDPLGPVLYALVQHLLILRVKQEVPTLAAKNVWFLDDGTLAGTASDLAKALSILQQEGPALGIHLNLHKTVVWSPAPHFDFNTFPLSMRRESEGIVVLGAPVGSPEAVGRLVNNRIDQIESL
jgi:hypothetical protein